MHTAPSRVPFLFLGLVFAVGCSSPSGESITPGLQAKGPPIELAPPEHGVQLSFGPFAVPSGDVQLCRTMKLDNDEPLAINRFDLKMLIGSHHFILFRAQQKADGSYYEYPDSVFDCKGTVNFDEWDFVMDVNAEGGTDWQLKDGQAFIFPPHAQIMMQAHFLNADVVKTSDQGGYDVLNMHSIPRSQVKHELLGMFTVNTRIAIPPKTTNWETSKNCSLSRTINIVAMTGHFHQQGLNFRVMRMSPVQGVDFGEIYCSGPDCTGEGSLNNWDHPLFKLFDPPQMVNGSTNGEAESLHFSCDYNNPTDRTISFGGLAQTQEHCNLFFQYYVEDPAVQNRLSCAEGSGGW